MPAIEAGRLGHVRERMRHLLPVVAALALWLGLIVAIASTYFGNASSPYNSCYATNGRAVSCAALEALR